MTRLARLAAHQFRYDQKAFWRNPAAVFFTVALPVIFLFIFATIFGNETITLDSGAVVKVSTYYVPGIMTLAVVSATMVNIAIGLTELRESGVLKRVRGTPLPTAAFVAGRVGNSVVISLVMVVIVTAIGHFAYGVAIPGASAVGVLVGLVVAAAAFCCLGFAITAAIPTEEAAPPITNAFVLPLYFLSGVFIPESEIPEGILNFASAFPIRHAFEALLAGFDPLAAGAAIEWGHLGVVAAWGALGLALAMRSFRWEPRGE